MLQLAYVSEREGGGAKAVEASAAAHDMLMALGTDPSHGMLTPPAVEGGQWGGNQDDESSWSKSLKSSGMDTPTSWFCHLHSRQLYTLFAWNLI